MEVRLYTMLFKSPEPEAAENFLDDIDPDSLEILQGAFGSPPLYEAKVRPRRGMAALPLRGSELLTAAASSGVPCCATAPGQVPAREDGLLLPGRRFQARARGAQQDRDSAGVSPKGVSSALQPPPVGGGLVGTFFRCLDSPHPHRRATSTLPLPGHPEGCFAVPTDGE